MIFLEMFHNVVCMIRENYFLHTCLQITVTFFHLQTLRCVPQKEPHFQYYGACPILLLSPRHVWWSIWCTSINHSYRAGKGYNIKLWLRRLYPTGLFPLLLEYMYTHTHSVTHVHTLTHCETHVHTHIHSVTHVHTHTHSVIHVHTHALPTWLSTAEREILGASNARSLITFICISCFLSHESLLGS